MVLVMEKLEDVLLAPFSPQTPTPPLAAMDHLLLATTMATSVLEKETVKTTFATVRIPQTGVSSLVLHVISPFLPLPFLAHCLAVEMENVILPLAFVLVMLLRQVFKL